MSTVARRDFASTPAREASATWAAIIQLLTKGTDDAKAAELKSIAGIAASLITDKAPKDAPIVVTCDGPRTRIYCLYDEDAVDGSDANEGALGFDPLKGDWAISLPCPADDLSWVQNALAAKSKRITARDQAEGIKTEEKAGTGAQALVFDAEGFLGS